jgi:hypothetical protein
MEDIASSNLVIATSDEHTVGITFNADLDWTTVGSFKGCGCAAEDLQRALRHRFMRDTHPNFFQIIGNILAEFLVDI